MRAAKEAIVAEAEAIAGSTDWGETAAVYRDLMQRWKSAGRASREVEDELWARFEGRPGPVLPGAFGRLRRA